MSAIAVSRATFRVVLQATPNTDETRPNITRWEWAFEANRRGIGFVESVVYTDGERRPVDWYEVCITGKWRWGRQHIYYDGPHCCFSIGPLHFNWRNWDCTKCQ